MKRDLLYEKNTGKIIFVSTHRDQNITGRNMSQKTYMAYSNIGNPSF